MKKKTSIAALGALLALAAHAQNSSVTLYGLLDVGVSYYSNIGGSSDVRMGSGITVPSFLGFRGEEDLGSGVKAIFDMESQFAISNGNTIGNLFGRNSWVGLESKDVGSIKLGNQFDFMNDSLTMADLVPAKFVGGLPNYPTGPTQFAGLNHPGYGPTAGYFDWDRTAQESVKNSVKYTTPKFGNFSAGAMYAFGENNSAMGNVLSFGANYKSGSWGMGAAYTGVRSITGMDGSSARFRTWGVGTNYQFEKLLAIANFTTTRNTVNDAAIWQTSFGGFYPLDNTWSVGTTYTYMKGNRELSNVHAHQFGAILNYNMSKRTSVYLSGSYQRANSGANALINGIYSEGSMPTTSDASSNNKQGVVRVGIRHFF